MKILTYFSKSNFVLWVFDFSRVKIYKNLTKRYKKVISLWLWPIIILIFLYSSTCANFKFALCKYAFKMVLVVTLQCFSFINKYFHLFVKTHKNILSSLLVNNNAVENILCDLSEENYAKHVQSKNRSQLWGFGMRCHLYNFFS